MKILHRRIFIAAFAAVAVTAVTISATSHFAARPELFGLPSVSVVARNAELAAIGAKIDTGGAGSLVFYSGTQPATVDTALSGNTALATLTFSTTSFGAPSGGIATANTITAGTATGTGTATFARAFAGNGTTAVIDYSVGGPASTITNVALTSNIATITTSAAHGFAVGQTVGITGLTNSALNGSYVVSAVGSSTTFSYPLTHTNISSTSDSGSASGTDINLASTSISTGVVVSISSLTMSHQ